MTQTQKRRKTFRQHYFKIRDAIFAVLGHECVRCGFSDMRALQIDHVNGGGSRAQAEKGAGRSYYKTILDGVLIGSDDYQILCANCNWIKRSENDENRTKID